MATYYVELAGGSLRPEVQFRGGDIYPAGGGGGGGGSYQSKSVSYTPTESSQSQTVTADVGYDALSQVDVSVAAISSTYVGSAVPRNDSTDLTASGATVTAPAGYYASNATKTIPNASTPEISAPVVNNDGSVTVDFGVTSGGYIAAGATNLTTDDFLAVQAAQTIYPSASDQSIASGKYLTGAQTIKGVTTTNLSAANIKKDVVIEVGDSADPDRIVSVTGTYEGGGGGYTNDDFADLSKPIGEVTTTRTSLPPYFMYQRTGITKFTGLSVTSLTSPSYAYCHTFYGCTALTEVNLPALTGLTDKNSPFRGCTSLQKVTLTSVKTTNSANCFQDDAALQGIVLPGAFSAGGNAGTTLGGSMFKGCTSLAYFDSAMVYNIQASTFTNCASLSVVVIRYSPNTNAGNISALANITAFDGTPFASDGTGGTLYVPSAKIATYQAATNWSTILGYANNQIKAIEGSYYETHWADGTVIS